MRVAWDFYCFFTDLKSSRQIRPPIYSLKQSKLRKRRVIRYAILYFLMLILFIALIAGPVIAGKFLTSLPQIPMNLQQPVKQDNNDTVGRPMTGLSGNGGAAATG